jgi:tetratricopeptide (TPR) repeat protein
MPYAGDEFPLPRSCGARSTLRTVREPLTIDAVEEFEFGARTPDARRAAAARFVDWAEERHPEDDEEVTPALLLVKAGEMLSLLDDHEAALEMYRRAVTAEGDVAPDVRCYLHHGLLQAADVDGARRLADEIRRSKPADPHVYAMIGEDYELAGDLTEANRWLNLGLRRYLAELEDEDAGEVLFDDALSDAIVLLSARRRVRHALGFPPDELDDLLPPLPE